jgi:hypothetical protein
MFLRWFVTVFLPKTIKAKRPNLELFQRILDFACAFLVLAGRVNC